MTIGLVPTQPFVDDVSTISATTANTWRANMAKCLDVVGGSQGTKHTPATICEIGGAGFKLSDGNVFQYDSRNVTRHLALIADSSSGNWERANVPRGAWQNTASGGTLDLRLEGLPHNNVLNTIVVRWIGAAGHGALPSLPSLTLRKIDDDGTETTLATASDTSASTGAYEVAHSITMSSITHTIDLSTYRYILTVAGETGGNFVANAKLLSLKATCAITSQSEW